MPRRVEKARTRRTANEIRAAGRSLSRVRVLHTGPAVPGVVHDLRLALGPGKLKDIRESNLAMIDQTLKTPWPEVEQDAGRAFGM